MNPFIQKLNLFGHAIFARYVKEYGVPVKIAIVGNGGLSPEDQDYIDGADCVIRFNNYATRDGIEYTADRFRCDILFTTGDLHSNGAEPHSVVIGVPFPFKCADVATRLNKWYPRSRSYMVNPYLNHLMVQEIIQKEVDGSYLSMEDFASWKKAADAKIDPRGWMHPFPSVGFTCLWHLYQLMTSVPTFKPIIFVAGFNWYSEKEGKTIQGWDMKRTDYPRHWNHNYPKEVRWIIENLMEHEGFAFSESSWRILETVKKTITS